MTAMLPHGQVQRRYLSAASQRGRNAYISIRTHLHELRRLHIEPKAVWVNQATADDMKALWFEVGAFDGKLPLGVAGVPMKVGMTGGQDYVFEYHDTRAEDHAARDWRGQVWKVQDNPLDGTH